MNKYEAMFIVRTDLNEEQKKSIFNNIADIVSKNSGKIISSSIWAQERKLAYPIKKQKEGIYYLVNFEIVPENLAKIQATYRLNENIIRMMITRTK